MDVDTAMDEVADDADAPLDTDKMDEMLENDGQISVLTELN